MSNLLLLWFICLSCKVFFTGCQVVLVNRNITDSFRVGKDGCTNNATVCPYSSPCQTDSGLCLCRDTEPSFGNPSANPSEGYGCARNENIRRGGGSFGSHCEIGPFQLIPYSHEDPATRFSYQENNYLFQRCSLISAISKFPDQTAPEKNSLVNESYVNLTVLNGTLYFKWKRSVPDLQGTIITLHLDCQRVSGSFYSSCLRAKVLGTWLPSDANPTTSPPMVIDKLNSPSSLGTQGSSTVKTTTAAPASLSVTTDTALPVSTTCACSHEGCSGSNAPYEVFIALFSISLVGNVFLGIIVGLQWKKYRRNEENLELKETENSDEERKERAENEISPYDEVVTKRGTNNSAFYNETSQSSPSFIQNKSGRLSDHNYEEPSYYQPLKRNHEEHQKDEHKYQSLITSQKKN